MVALNSKVNAGELLFTALDSGDMEKTNEIMDKHPESVDARDEEKRVRRGSDQKMPKEGAREKKIK